jgi:polyisoprenoid-binding protein YceI
VHSLPLLRWLSLLAVAFVAITFPARASSALPAAGDYAVDASTSGVGFSVTNFVVTNVDGKFTRFDGHVVVGDSLATTTVEASVDVSSIDTGIKQRDDHLRSSDYFDVARFPRMTFKSSQLWGTPERFGMKGALTIKGITKEVVFGGRIADGGVIIADTTIDRQNFGITSGPSIKNEVRLRLSIRIAKNK